MTRRQQAHALFEQGHSKSEIARIIGVNQRTVRRWFQEQRIEKTQLVVEQPNLQHSHAAKRADLLQTALKQAIVASKWPVINPDALIVEPRVDKVYNQSTGEVTEQARSPQTYVTDILRVNPITDYKNKTFIFSRVQNATPVDKNLYNNLVAYAKHLNAEIVLGPDTYETAWWHETNPDCREYDELAKPYLCFGRMEIGPNFFFAGEMNILTTASAPISDLVSYSMGKWCVIPHSKQQLESIPVTDPNEIAHQILTTGSLTIPKVIPRKAGIKSIFHHIMGFVVVEFDSVGDVFCRHVSAEDDGSFYDLWWRVENGKVVRSKQRIDYIMPGDVHRAKLDRANVNDVLTTFGFADNKSTDENLITKLKPRYVILQDLHDGEADNHWTANDIGTKVELAARNRQSIAYEIEGDAAFLHNLSQYHRDVSIIVDESNHDLRLERYVREGRYRTDGFNVRFGLKLEDRYLQHREDVAVAIESRITPPSFSLYEYAVRNATKERLDRVEWIHDGRSKVINGVEVGHHGFRGSNGSKATIAGYARIGRKISYGDKHVPAIRDGAFQAGVIVLQQGYNKGPSSWAVSHIIQYANGKRCIVTLNDGKYTNQKG